MHSSTRRRSDALDSSLRLAGASDLRGGRRRRTRALAGADALDLRSTRQRGGEMPWLDSSLRLAGADALENSPARIMALDSSLRLARRPAQTHLRLEEHSPARMHKTRAALGGADALDLSLRLASETRRRRETGRESDLKL